MAFFNKDNSEGSTDNTSADKAKGTIAGVFNSIAGVNRTNGVSPIGLIDRNGVRQPPGFTPNSNYVTSISTSDNDTWYGALLQTHPDYTGNSGWYQYKGVGTTKDLSTSERFDRSKSLPNFKDDTPDPYTKLSTRDYHLLFNDSSTDYFKHGLHVIDNKTPIRSDKNSREAWDGSEDSTPLRLSNVLRDNTGLGGTPYENGDPVLFGFELIIDAVSSPLLNGSVEDFIDQFSSISEVAARKYVLSDFKQQFIKLFKTKGSVFIDQTADNQIKTSIVTSNYSNTDSQTNVFEPGKKAYLSYYLKKVSGLNLLLESNQPAKKKFLVDYRNDVLKLTFSEDVSLTMGTLSHLYKLLYWSKASGKNIIPENLLRFNCDIIVSEVRNLNRVRKAIDTGNLEVVKENVSRHVYSLRECQLWFDLPSHDDEIDLSQAPKEFDQFVVTMDYKYVTSKFERWVPDRKGFGIYAGYNNGALWKVGNPNSRGETSTGTQSKDNAGTLNDNSVPKFFTAGLNTLKHNGVKTPIVLESYSTSQDVINNDSFKKDASTGAQPNNSGDESDGSNETTSNRKESRTAKAKSSFETFKQNSKKAGQKLAKNLEKSAKAELQGQINTRLRLLNNTLDKIRNASGLGRMREPTNIYKVPYYYEGIASGLGGQVSSRFFYDVHNSLRDFAGDAVGGQIGGLLRGGNNPGLFGGG